MGLHLDFETRAVLDLTKVGADKYARHSSTSVLCASFTIDDSQPMQWRPWQNQPMPIALQSALYDDDVIIEGWNVSFERLILKHVLKIDIDPARFRCTMARARSMALPGKLGLCAKALHMPVQKSDDKIMRKWCKPLVKGGWADDPAEYEQLCGYCDVDVLTEKGLGGVLRELTEDERLDWEITERINDNGIPIDMALVRAAQHYAGDELVEIKERLSELTRGVVTSPKQFERLKDWLPFEMDSLDAAARSELLDNEEIQGDVREVIQLVDDGGRASTAKFAAMETRADENDRVHGAYIFNGAGQTGRFSSTGAQLHNFIRKKLDNTEDVIDAILRGVSKQELLDLVVFPKDDRAPHNVLTTLSRLLRPSLCAENGKEFVWGDWKAIEARVLPWLSRENSASALLELFLSGADVYAHQAALMFGIPLTEVSKDQRQAGKVAILSCFGQHTRVLTDNGLKDIVAVTPTDKLWDGHEWVSHDGVVVRGTRATINLAGIAVTPEHLFLAANEWKRADQLVSNENILYRALEHGSGSLPWWDTFTDPLVASCLSKFAVRAVPNHTMSLVTTYEKAHLHDAMPAQRNNLITGEKTILATLRSWLTPRTGADFSVVSPRASIVATTPKTPRIRIMVGGEFTSMKRGAPIEKLFSRIWSRLMVGINRSLSLIEWMWIKDTNRETFNSLHDVRTSLTAVPCRPCSGALSNLKPVYDILNAGPRNRFTVTSDEGFLIAHNCGYGGGVGAFRAMAKNYDMDVDDATADMYKVSWRAANPWAQRFWRTLEVAAYNAVRNQGQVFPAGRVSYLSTGSVLWCLLPSGRMIAYPFPEIREMAGRFGPELTLTCIKGAWAPKKGMNYWPRMKLWGGILAENITQAEAASLLRWGLRELYNNGWIDCMVGHTHDEILEEVPVEEVPEARIVLKDIMERGPDWAAGLPLAADIESGAVYGK